MLKIRTALASSIIGIALFAPGVLGQTPFLDEVFALERWQIGGFDSKEQVVDLVASIRGAAASGSISPITQMLPAVQFQLNCFLDNSIQESGRLEALEYEAVARIWRRLVEENTNFIRLQNLKFDDLGFNSYGASSPGGSLWIVPFGGSDDKITFGLFLNTFESCETLATWSGVQAGYAPIQ